MTFSIDHTTVHSIQWQHSTLSRIQKQRRPNLRSSAAAGLKELSIYSVINKDRAPL
jgi:hypothetical protein